MTDHDETDEQPMLPTRPALGGSRMVFVPHIADSEAPTVGQINAATSVDLTEWFASPEAPTPAGQMWHDAPRVPTREDFEGPSETTYDWPDLEYVYDPDGTESLAWLSRDPSPLYVYNPQGERVGIVESVDRVDDNGLDITIIALPRLWGGDQA